MINVTNEEFLTAIFNKDLPHCHVTDFPYPPDNIPKDKNLIAWKGDYYSRYQLQPNTNQYFTISTFYADKQDQARRRKALYRQTHCVVLDDVREKLSEEAAGRLPQPSWILETSKGSFQWGYILSTSCTEAERIDNLNDGLIQSDLAPQGKDPGQRGITRYVRLPGGINNKTCKGETWQCRLTLWQPFNTVTLEQLAEPFAINLNAPRRESRVDGAANVSDHPLLTAPGIKINEVRSAGRFDVTCPWVGEHTGQDDSGSAVFTNEDGSLGFKCHHGSCDGRTGRDLLYYIEEQDQGFIDRYKNWQLIRDLNTVVEPSLMAPQANVAGMSTSNIETSGDALQTLFDKIKSTTPGDTEQRELCEKFLKHLEDMSKIDQKHWYDCLRDHTGWSKPEFKEILTDFRKKWYEKREIEIFQDVVFVREINQFYQFSTAIFYTPEAFQNSFCNEDADVKKSALIDGMSQKVDKIDYAPKQPRIFTQGNIQYVNTWSETSQSTGSSGDVSRWLQHFDVLGWTEHKAHIEKWMAHTIRRPEIKINHILLLGSGEGCGKDFLLYPLMRGMGDNHQHIEGNDLISNFNDYLMSTKYLHINETELADHKEAKLISNKLKPLAAAPPEHLSVNPKNVKRIKIRNVVNISMTTNSTTPFKLSGPSRRFYPLWSDLVVTDDTGGMKDKWVEYWEDQWNWMRSGGWESVLWYLINQVDISDFNPRATPPSTDFLQSIQEASKSPMEETLETFIEKQHGVFKSDLLRSSDMSSILRTNNPFFESDVYCDVRSFTPRKIGMVLKQMRCMHIKTDKNRLWILRNYSKYQLMTQSDLNREYERQIKAVLGDSPITIIK